jgi:hypothetical protein
VGNINNNQKGQMKLIIALAILIAATTAHALPGCLTNLDIYCVGNVQMSLTQNGTTGSPTNELHGMDLLNSSGGRDGATLNLYLTDGSCPSSDEVIAVIVYSCNDNPCGLGGKCSPGSHEDTIKISAGCNSVSGTIGMMYGNCCAITWTPFSCRTCTPIGPQQ